MRISDWSSDVCSSDLDQVADRHVFPDQPEMLHSFHALRAQGSGPVVITTAIFSDDVGGSLERPMRRGIGQICKKGRRTPPVLFQKGNQLTGKRVGRIFEIGSASCRERVCKYV